MCGDAVGGATGTSTLCQAHTHTADGTTNTQKTPSENRTAQAFAAALFGSEDSGADPSMRTASLSKAL